ncbi:MAG: hypothetical protein V7704_10965 [Aurantimonas endophytica]|uniref:Uncharacterized protein n=1 Tax=Aurantimonas endophytica TaxID=1522175 RepID=A0A7W6MRU4_9HYPH|nr:hypothetical protein [Aurantimonas endophytica]MBB4005432.1 hypothetical protein [Aurantimonas endophytica]MCO6405912.1 hypothetical protein [Aurantimonas endophytica]
MSNDDDRQLAGEIEAALRALGIVNSRCGPGRLVEPLVRELRSGETMAGKADPEQREADTGP